MDRNTPPAKYGKLMLRATCETLHKAGLGTIHTVLDKCDTLYEGYSVTYNV